MLKNEQSAGTKAGQSTEVETLITSSHNNGNTPVVCRFSSPEVREFEKTIQVMSASGCVEIQEPVSKYCPPGGHRICYSDYQELIDKIIADVKAALANSLAGVYDDPEMFGKTVSIKCQSRVDVVAGQSNSKLSI